MFRPRRFSYAVALIAAVPWLAPQLAFAQQPTPTAPTQPRVHDIELDEQGGFHGQVVDPSGNPRTQQAVQLLFRGKRVTGTRTDEAGVFRFQRLRGGVHQIALAEGAATVRCWQFGTAPPAAEKSILLISDGETIRGQHPISHLFTNPLAIALAIAAAIAIPIAINNSDSSPSSP